MATAISAGKYYIVSALVPKDTAAYDNLALHLYWGWTGNGTSVNLKYLDYKDYEIWEVSYPYNDGDVMRITSCLAGRSLDVASGIFQDGTNVQIYDANSTGAQKWRAEKTSDSITIDHNSYPLYYIRNASNTNYSLDVQNGYNDSSANVQIFHNNGTDAQKWAFVPYALFYEPGIYEIRSMLNTNLAMDDPAASKTSGTQLQLYTANHTDAQKFNLRADGDQGWMLRNIASDLMVDAQSANYNDGTHVILYKDNGTKAQRWHMIQHGTTVVEGYDCKVVTFGAEDKQNKVIEAPSGVSSSGVGLALYESNGTDSQLWALLPTKKSAESLVVPSDCGVSSTLGGSNKSRIPWDGTGSSIVFPNWSCPNSWLAGQNHFQIRYRRRFHSPVNGSWTNWVGDTSKQSISEWKDITVYTANNRAWLADGIDMAYDYVGSENDDGYPYDDAELYFEVRCAQQSSEELLYGSAGTGTGRVPFAPTLSLISATINGYGLVLGINSNYKYGLTNLGIYNITRRYNNRNYEMYSDANSNDGPKYISGSISNGYGTITISRDKLVNLSPDGVVKITYNVGTSELSYMANLIENRETGTVSINTGGGNFVPTIVLNSADKDTRTVKATVSDIGKTRMWITAGDDPSDGKFEIAQNRDGTFDVPYPFGQPMQLETLCYSSDMSKWGSTWINVPSTNNLVTKYLPCHAWNMIDSDGKIGPCMMILELRMSEAPETNGSISMDYEARSLSGRAFQTVSFASAKKKTFSVEGVLLGKYPEMYNEEVIDNVYMAPDGMVDCLKHAIYRAPNGEFCTVAVTGVSYESKPDEVTLVTGEVYKGYTIVKVDMIRESF